jgi:hypothetical protein
VVIAQDGLGPVAPGVVGCGPTLNLCSKLPHKLPWFQLRILLGRDMAVEASAWYAVKAIEQAISFL